MNYRVHLWWNRFSHNWKLIASYMLGTKPPTFNPVGSYSVKEAKKRGLISPLKLFDKEREDVIAPEVQVTLLSIPADYKVERRDNTDPSVLDVIGMLRSYSKPVQEAAGPVADESKRVEKEQSNDIPDQAGSSPSHPRGD